MSDGTVTLGAFGACVASWVIGGVMWTAALVLWLASRLGFTVRDLIEVARGR